MSPASITNSILRAMFKAMILSLYIRMIQKYLSDFSKVTLFLGLPKSKCEPTSSSSRIHTLLDSASHSLTSDNTSLVNYPAGGIQHHSGLAGLSATTLLIPEKELALSNFFIKKN